MKASNSCKFRHEKILGAQPLPKDQLLNSLPPEWPQDLRPVIQKQIKTDGRKVVVLDDDPTGTQTVHGLPILTEWYLDALSVRSRRMQTHA